MSARRTVHRGEAMLAYAAVAAALGMTFDVEHVGILADLSHDMEDVMLATRAMRRLAATVTDPARIVGEGSRLLRLRRAAVA